MSADLTRGGMRWTRRELLWLGVLTIMSIFQLWRGAWVDGGIFVALLVVLVADTLSGGRIALIRRPITVRRTAIVSSAAVVAAVLIVAPRHGLVVMVTMVMVGVAVAILAWPATPDRDRRPDRVYARSSTLFSVVGAIFCLWEAFAYIFSNTLPGFTDAFPTISVLLDPVLGDQVGRTVFVVVWTVAGLALLRLRGIRGVR